MTLGEVATLHQEQGPTEIRRDQRRRIVTVSGELQPGYSLGTVAARRRPRSGPGPALRCGAALGRRGG